LFLVRARREKNEKVPLRFFFLFVIKAGGGGGECGPENFYKLPLCNEKEGGLDQV
jgi:hypothetical protein